MGGLADLYGTSFSYRGVGRAAGSMSGVADAYTSYKATNDKLGAYFVYISNLELPEDAQNLPASYWRDAITDIRSTLPAIPFSVADLDASTLDSLTKAAFDESFGRKDVLATLRVWQGMLDADYQNRGAGRREIVVPTRGRELRGDGGGGGALTCWPGYGMEGGVCKPTPTAYAGGGAVGALAGAAIGFALGGVKGAAIGAGIGAAAGAGGVYAASMTEAAQKPK